MLRSLAIMGAVLLAFALGTTYAQDATRSGTEPATTSNYSAPANNAGTSNATNDRDRNGFDFGWLGLAGLLGLTGLMPRSRDDRRTEVVGQRSDAGQRNAH